jgi:hypothetical protein
MEQNHRLSKAAAFGKPCENELSHMLRISPKCAAFLTIFCNADELLIAGTTALQPLFLLLLRGTIHVLKDCGLDLVGVETNREEKSPIIVP